MGKPSFKSPDIIVLPRAGSLQLINQSNNLSRTISGNQMRQWLEWMPGQSDDGFNQLLLTDSFARECTEEVSPVPAPDIDGSVLSLAAPYVRWYAETTDLHVLLNTRSMNCLNPLLVLGPYGSLCWRGVVEGWPIGAIRAEACRVFGKDEVRGYLARLIDLGFVQPCSCLSSSPASTGTLRKEFPAPDVQFRISKAAVPWYCLWEITRCCNLRCRICYLPEFESQGPSCSSALKIAEHMADSGVLFVSIMGGEALMYPALEEVINLLRSRGVYVKLITNGALLTTERARRLKQTDLNQIEVSFDGVTPEAHDWSRGKGAFKRASDALENAREAGLPHVGIVLTVHSGNLHDVHLLRGFMRQIGVAECYISTFKKAGKNAVTSGVEQPTPSQIASLGRFVREFNQEQAGERATLLPACTCGKTSVVIGPDGEMRGCSFLCESSGNIQTIPILNVWDQLAPPSPTFCKG